MHQYIEVKLGTLKLLARADGNPQVLVFRIDATIEDAPHLTVNWGNPDRHIHIHLTINNPKINFDVVKIPEELFLSRAATFISQHVAELLCSNIFQVTTTWLSQNGYKIRALPGMEVRETLEKISPPLHDSKKRRMKYSIDETIMPRIEDFDVPLLPPTALITERFTPGTPIIAECDEGENMGRDLWLYSVEVMQGINVWVALEPNMAALFEIFENQKEQIVPIVKEMIGEEMWEKYRSALELDRDVLPS